MCSLCRSHSVRHKKKGLWRFKAKKVYINADEPHGAHTFRVLVLRRAKLSKKESTRRTDAQWWINAIVSSSNVELGPRESMP